jgi:diacylglycerol kinase (ATP)
VYSFILNPNAGSGRAAKVRPLIERYMTATGLDFDVIETRAPSESIEASRSAAMSSSVVVSVGGDGSLHYVAAGMIEARLVGSRSVLGILPVGTGNDFARMLGMPADPEACMSALLNSETIAADHGWAIWEEDGVDIRRPFINCAGIGLDAKSALLATKLKPFVGNAAYLIAPALTVLTWRSPGARIVFDLKNDVWEGELMLASVANGKWIGGGIEISPDADIDDRVLDLCMIPKISIPRAYWLLSKAAKGKHVGRSGVVDRQIERITVTTDDPVPVYVDGEPGALSVTKASFEVAAGELPVLKPRQ